MFWLLNTQWGGQMQATAVRQMLTQMHTYIVLYIICIADMEMTKTVKNFEIICTCSSVEERAQ